jgi:hypothetical protein
MQASSNTSLFLRLPIVQSPNNSTQKGADALPIDLARTLVGVRRSHSS